MNAKEAWISAYAAATDLSDFGPGILEELEIAYEAGYGQAIADKEET
jgi:hypothetical protein